MNCPRCGSEMEGERCDFVVGKSRKTPQMHYRCDECDAEFVGTPGELRMLDGADWSVAA